MIARIALACGALVAALALPPALAAAQTDTTDPQTTITAGPSDTTTDDTPTFEFESDEPGTFECRVDAEDFAACTSPHTTAKLSPGLHRFQVRAIDSAGNVDASPATRSFDVQPPPAEEQPPAEQPTSPSPPADPPPDTFIVSGPAGVTTNPFPVFEFGSNEPGTTFFCRLQVTDVFRACTSPIAYPRLGDGGYQFDVVAVDQAGNVDPTPATREFTVDTIPNLDVLSRRVRYRRGAVRVRLGCEAAPALGPCVGRLALKRTDGVVIGALRYGLAAGEQRTVTVRIKPSRRRALLRFEVMPVDADIRMEGAGGRFDTLIQPLGLLVR